MKIVVVGATGTVGKAVVTALQGRHEVIKVGSKSGDLQADIKDSKSIRALFEKTGKVDAVACTAGKVHFGDFAKLTETEMLNSLKDKFLGQVNLVLIGRDYVNDNGSFTLMSGVLSHDPIRLGVCASAVNGAVDCFAKGASIEMPRGIRINSISPGLLQESLGHYGPYFPGHKTVTGADVGRAYVKSIEGHLTGQTIHVL